MHADLQRSWNRSETLKDDLLKRVALLPDMLQHKAATAEEWSPLQIISHLLIAERFVLGYRTNTTGPKINRANPLVIALLCAVLRAGIRLPAPEVMTPESEPLNGETLAQEWQTERKRLYSCLIDVSPGEPFGMHPYFGVVTARQVMTMLEAHLQYHTKRFPTNKP